MSNINNQACPLCGCSHLTIRASVQADRLAASYQNSYRTQVSHLFAGHQQISLIDCSECNLGFFSPIAAGDANLYEDLQKFPWYYQEEKPEFEFALRNILASDRILEIGCGAGAFGLRVPTGAVYTGLEFNEAALGKAKSAGLDVRMQTIEAHAKENAGTYDVVCSFQVLEHISDPRSFLLAARQCLKPGGRLIVAVPGEDSFLNLATNELLNLPPHHVTRWRDSTLRQAANILQCEVTEIWHEPVAPYHLEWYERILLGKYFGLLPATSLGELPRNLFTRLVGKISGIAPLRRWFASQAAKSYEHDGRGHTVGIVMAASA